jgi:[protein-PII] uridylyltransferase
VVAALLYLLWDSGLKVGHAVRTVSECLKQARGDQTIRTTLLETRFLAGYEPLFQDFQNGYAREFIGVGAAAFVATKLNERDHRHDHWGGSRYLLEPNIKEGKGGLRDLHTLLWIAKVHYKVRSLDGLIAEGIFAPDEAAACRKAFNFLVTVRCHMHFLAGRSEDRLTFDLQREIAGILGYTDHAGTQSVERFMKHYFLVAKEVGDLTRTLCADLELDIKRPSGFNMFALLSGKRAFAGFKLERGRLGVTDPAHFKDKPIDLLRLFEVANRNGYDIHPQTWRLVYRSLRLIGRALRADPEANALFLTILCGRTNPEPGLRRMNEAGVLGRFIPEWGRVVAQMQFNMYHFYTVDEHTLFAIGILHAIERGELAKEAPIASELFTHLGDDPSARRVLYIAVLLHDIAKGRSRSTSHSVLGARIARKLCPRLGLDEAETDTVAWLVRHHLCLSEAAFRRDLDDPKTIDDLTHLVGSPSRLRLLLILTVADIRAVGPGRWNDWKATLLRGLYTRVNARLTGEGPARGLSHQVRGVQYALREALVAEEGDAAWTTEQIDSHLSSADPPYWLAFGAESYVDHARLMHRARQEGAQLMIDINERHGRGVSNVVIYTQDHAGLMARVAGALTLCGMSVVGAHVFTLRDGMTLDIFRVQTPAGEAPRRKELKGRLRRTVTDVLGGKIDLFTRLEQRQGSLSARTAAMGVRGQVVIDNQASDRFTVVEVNGRDEPGLLYQLARAISAEGLRIATARVSTYGVRVIDVFYVKDVFGLKITHKEKLAALQRRLRGVLAEMANGSAGPSDG